MYITVNYHSLAIIHTYTHLWAALWSWHHQSFWVPAAGCWRPLFWIPRKLTSADSAVPHWAPADTEQLTASSCLLRHTSDTPVQQYGHKWLYMYFLESSSTCIRTVATLTTVLPEFTGVQCSSLHQKKMEVSEVTPTSSGICVYT